MSNSPGPFDPETAAGDVFDFVQMFDRDEQQGRLRPLSEYLRRFPQHEAAIAHEYLGRLSGASPSLEVPPETGTSRRSGGASPSVIERVAARFGQGPRLRLPAEEGDPGDASGAGSDGATRRGGEQDGGEPAASGQSGQQQTGADHAAEGRGHYQVLGEIARGGMGVVLKGHDADLGRDVAMKVLRPEHLGKPAIVQRFVEEAQIGGQLQHPGIVPVYEMGLMADDRPYFTMKLVKGRTLAALLAERASPAHDRRRLLGIFEQICLTVAYAHARRVIHRDLKPANVMVGAFGEVQVVDWGLAKVMPVDGQRERPEVEQPRVSIIETVRSTGSSAGSAHSMAGSVMGTPAYMAPEQAQGEVHRVDERADVFALGAILCELLSGSPPYAGEDSGVLSQAAQARLDPARERLAGCGADPELVELALHCMTPAVGARPRNAAEVAEAVQRYLAHLEERAHQAEVSAVRAEQAHKARRLTLALAGTVVAAVLAGGWFYLGTLEQRSQAEQSINRELTEARLLAERGELQAAIAAADKAQALSANLGATPALRDQVQAELASLRGEQQDRQLRAAEAARARALLDGLQGLLASLDIVKVEREGLEQVDARFVQLFDEYGLDVFDRPVDVVVADLHALGQPAFLGTVLDEWARTRFMLDGLGSGAFLRLVDMAIAIDPDPLRAQLRQAVRAEDRETLEQLVQAEAALGWPPATVTTLWMYCEFLGYRTDIDLWNVLRACQLRHPEHAGVNLLLGVESRERRDHVQAIRYLYAANALDPGNKITVSHLARSMAIEGHCVEAARIYMDLLRASPGDPLLLRKAPLDDLANAIRKAASAEDYAAFRQLAETVLEQAPDWTAMQVNYAQFLLMDPVVSRRDPLRALQLAQQALAGEPAETADLQTMVGLAHYRLGYYADAVRALDENIGAGGGAVVDHVIRAMALKQQGRDTEGRPPFEAALEWKQKQEQPLPDDVQRLFEEAIVLFAERPSD